MPIAKTLIAVPAAAVALMLSLTGCAGQPSATATVTVTASPTAAASEQAAAKMPNDYSSPDEVAVSMFRDILNKDAKQYIELLSPDLAKEYGADLTKTVKYADVSKYSDFTVTSVGAGWSGNDAATAGAVFFTYNYDGQPQRGKIKVELNDPAYAPNEWHIGDYGLPYMLSNPGDTKSDGTTKAVPLQISGNGQNLTFGTGHDASTLYLFPGEYTVTGQLAADDSYSKATQTVKINAIQRPHAGD